MAREPDWTPHFVSIDPPGRAPGRCWLAELRDATGWSTVPAAVASLTDYSPMLGMVLDYIIVPDHLRRQGHATRLIRACQERWPGLILTDPISPEGEALLGSLEGAEVEATG